MRGESSECLRFQEFASMATERKQEVIALKFVDTGIIKCGQGVEFTKLVLAVYIPDEQRRRRNRIVEVA